MISIDHSRRLAGIYPFEVIRLMAFVLLCKSTWESDGALASAGHSDGTMALYAFYFMRFISSDCDRILISATLAAETPNALFVLINIYTNLVSSRTLQRI